MDNIENAKAMIVLTGAQYPLLYDPEGIVARRYGVYNLLGDGVSAPSVFIIGKNRSLEWSYVGKNAGDRPSIDDMLSKID
jgi:peroxiredoxin